MKYDTVQRIINAFLDFCRSLLGPVRGGIIRRGEASRYVISGWACQISKALHVKAPGKLIYHSVYIIILYFLSSGGNDELETCPLYF